MLSYSPFLQMGKTPILAGRFEKSGVNQYGLIPQNSYQFKNGTLLVNHGKATDASTLNVRRSTKRGHSGSSPGFQGNAVGKQLQSFLGLATGSANETKNVMSFCQEETFSLRLCMAKGLSACQRENAALTACLSQAAPLKEAIKDAGRRYQDWFIQSVSANYMDKFRHRPQDNKEHYAQEMKFWSRKQAGRAIGKHKKVLAWDLKSQVAGTNLPYKSHLPINR